MPFKFNYVNPKQPCQSIDLRETASMLKNLNTWLDGSEWIRLRLNAFLHSFSNFAPFSTIRSPRAGTHWSRSRAFNSQPRETHCTKFEVWSFANFHFGWEIICKRLISLLVHLSRCPLSILSQFLSKMIVCETSNFTAKLRTSYFVQCVSQCWELNARDQLQCVSALISDIKGYTRY